MKPVRAILAITIVGLAGWSGIVPIAKGGADKSQDTPSLEAFNTDRPSKLAQAPGGGAGPRGEQGARNDQGPRGEGREPRRGSREGDGPSMGGGPAGDGGGRDPMGPEFVNDIVKVAHDYDPELGARLEEIKKRNPERIREAIGHTNGPNLMRLVYLLRNNPEMYKMRIEEFKLNRESEDIAKQVREGGSDKAKLDKLRQQLRAKVTEQFSQRQKIRERELSDLEKRIDELRKEIRSRKEKQAELIAEREKELIEKPAKVEW